MQDGQAHKAIPLSRKGIKGWLEMERLVELPDSQAAVIEGLAATLPSTKKKTHELLILCTEYGSGIVPSGGAHGWQSEQQAYVRGIREPADGLEGGGLVLADALERAKQGPAFLRE